MAKATIKDVAQLAGVSVATVSRVLNGQRAKVKAKTCEAVDQACNQLGFKLDRAARRLKTGETRVIGLILNRTDPSDSFARQLLLGLTDRMSADDYHLVVIPEHEISPLGSIEYLKQYNACDGVVLTHTAPKDTRVSWLDSEGFPFVTHGRTLLDFEHDYVDFDNEAFVQRAVADLAQRGARRLGIILPSANTTYEFISRRAFNSACTAFGIEGEAVSQINNESSTQALISWARDHQSDYQGLVLLSDAILPALFEGERLNPEVRRPEYVVKALSHPLGYQLNTGIRVVTENLYRAGEQLADTLINRLREPTRAPIQTLIPVAYPID
jgi:LacI family transcriptional regulator